MDRPFESATLRVPVLILDVAGVRAWRRYGHVGRSRISGRCHAARTRSDGRRIARARVLAAGHARVLRDVHELAPTELTVASPTKVSVI